MATTKFCKVSELLPCEVYVGEDLPEDHPSAVDAGKVRAVINKHKGIPPCVWIRNARSTPVTVILSPSRPHRLVTSGGVEASDTGAGLTLETALYDPLSAGSLASPGETYVFGISREDRYAYITIYDSNSGRIIYHRNYRLPAGAKAVSKPNEDLVVYLWNKELMTNPESDHFVPQSHLYV